MLINNNDSDPVIYNLGGIINVNLRNFDAAIDCLINFAGWSDKYSQIVGCNNPVSGPYYNFTNPEPVGVVGIIAPNETLIF